MELLPPLRTAFFKVGTVALTNALYNEDEVRKAIALLVEPGQVFEIRALDAKLGSQWKTGIVSGYFNNIDKAVEQLSNISKAKSIYITLNPVMPDLLARRCNRLDYSGKDELTGDQHITRRRRLLIDTDPKRPAGISSTQDEMQSAFVRANEVETFLAGVGFPKPVKAGSGNGGHLLYLVDLPADDGGLLKNVLQVLAAKFDDAVVEIDQSVFNPSRITKLYGTLACKGDSTPERPHRWSQITSVPKPLEVVSRELLEKVAGMLPAEPTPAPKAPTGITKTVSHGRNGGFDVRQFLSQHGVRIKSETAKNGGTVIELETCPFNPEHGGHGEVAVFESADGKLGFKCHHNGCSDKHWQDFREHFDPGCYDREPDTLQLAVDDDRPKVRLPGDDHLLSDFATELAKHVADKDIFLRNGEIVVLKTGDLRPLKPTEFRTWVEQYVICYRIVGHDKKVFEIGITMSDDNATAVLASSQFRNRLRLVRQINNCRLPIRRASGEIELLAEGYDDASQTLTIGGVDYSTDMTLADAVGTINDLMSEFIFADGVRSKAVAVSAMVGLYANGLLPPMTLRPCFIFVANAEGAGKSVLVAVATTPTHGMVPTGRKADDDDEVAKLLLATVREARPLVFFDNLKGHLSSETLEGFLSAPIFEGRKLGVNEYIRAENLATVFITGNGLTVSPDMRRRSLFVELRLEVERAEDRIFKRPLDMPTLLAMRPKVLASLWSLVLNWQTKGCPLPSRSHSAFTSWSNIIGGIVEASGLGCPLETAEVATVADNDGDDMRKLVMAMVGAEKLFTFAELVDLARKNGLFESIVGDEELDRRAKTLFGRLLGRYDRRLVADWRFVVQGSKNNRRFRVEKVSVRDDGMMRDDISPDLVSPIAVSFDLNIILDHPIIPDPEAVPVPSEPDASVWLFD